MPPRVRQYSGGFAHARHQPLKSVYLLYEVLTAFVRIPFWALLAIPRGLRPRKSWSWARTFNVQLLRHLTALGQIVGPLRVSPSYLALVPGIGYHGVWVEPVSSEHIVGKLKVWAMAAGAVPVKLPGYWLHKSGSTIKGEAPLMPGEKIVYALHGGAYTRLSAHPSDPTAGITRGLLDRVDSVHRTFTIEYRLSSTKPYPEEHSFPTALLDALTGYNYLVNTLHIPASDIIVEGDSAGGNLALALTRYLVEHPIAALPPPTLLLLLSPWCDLGTSHAYPGSSFYTCRKSDYIPLDNLENAVYAIAAFTGPFGLGASEINPYISPASIHADTSFAGFPSTFISAGGAEVLLDSIRTLHQKMAKDMGDAKVRYLEARDGVHDFLVFDQGWHEPERSMTLTAIADWVATESS
ncbi:Abhydrolase-3 domain-containing protein [Mycena sanguinolenta]|uniref:Abhydrolase-3 domain-containing protein n=1 Tax=Mycena sanguinolenta TaxID=230812 RepID=A0A8H7DK17_9AGAR|nr:Abhydrolase-3 domain-containing protein [Mycena sanguinolenta]